MTTLMWLAGAMALVAIAGPYLGDAADACVGGKSPIFIVPGLMGSNLLGDLLKSELTAAGEATPELHAAQQAAAEAAAATSLDPAAIYQAVAAGAGDDSPTAAGVRGDCPFWALNDVQVWPPLAPSFVLFKKCFYYLMQMQYDKATGKFSNATNAEVWANTAPPTGADDIIWKLAGYDKLANFISKSFGYTLGKDLFGLPYDFRQDLTSMADSTGQLQMLADRVAAAVAANCGKKAILIGHSMGTIVSLGLLRRNADWRQQNVKGYLALAPPFGGAAPAVNGRISGGGTIASGGILKTFVSEIQYGASKGMPSVVMMLPYAQAFGGNMVVASTPQRNYTVDQMQSLMQDIGDTAAFEFYNQVRTLDATVAAGPVPGVETYCIFGARVNTTKTFRYALNLQPGTQMNSSAVVPLVVGKGDGTVNLESLRLCRRITSTSKISELGGGVDHTNVVSNKATALPAIGRALRKLLA